MITDIAVNVITGPLGSGKTTAIRHLLAKVPPKERWAVVVNEFGKVGLDGAFIENDGITVREVAGGCVCCVGSLDLKIAMVRLLREVRPDRVLIEPSGLALPTTVIDTLRAKGLREAVDVQATLTIVDARRFCAPWSDTLEEQIRLADVLILNQRDLATEEQISEFVLRASLLTPPKVGVAVVSEGAVDVSWLQRPAAVQSTPKWVVGAQAVSPTHNHTHNNRTESWVFSSSEVFSFSQLQALFQRWMTPSAEPSMQRIKAFVNTDQGWRMIQGIVGQVRTEGALWRRDSRVEIILEPGCSLQWNDVDRDLLACRL